MAKGALTPYPHRLEAYPTCVEMTMYKNTSLSLLVCLLAAVLAPAAEPDILIADFEWETWEGSGWTPTGEAFGPGPARGTLPNQMRVTGYKGERLVNSFHGGDRATGTLTSPRLTIERGYINFLIGGGGFEGKTCMNLLVDGRVVRTATGRNTKPGGSERLDWHAWDVRNLAGKEAVLQIVDAHSGGWGHINVDHIVQSNQPKALALRVDLGEPATDLPAVALAPLLEAIQKKELAERYEEKAAREKLEAAGVRLGAWYRIGPFRDQPPLLSWMENVASSFRHEFEAETDMRDHGHAPRLDKQYPAENFPATPGAARRWTVQPEWIDGYLCDLPRGPAPSAGETQYVYRTITASAPVTVEMDFAVRAPASDRKLDGPYQEWWRRKARYRCLLNGEEVLRFEGDGPLPGRVALELRAGANHFLAKITNNRHSYGFSFALAGLHPAPRRPGAHEQPWRPFRRRRAGDVPYYCETDPSRRKPVVEMTFDACLGRLAEMAGRRPEDVPDMLGADPHEDGWAAKVRHAYVAAYRYREALVRLRDFRFLPAPMPGIESAVRDSRGRIVTPMEKALEGYPVSPGAARYAERVESLRREVEPLLERLVDSGRPEFAAVVRLDEAIDAMWEEEIRNLPPILFLERPQYQYDALMFTGSGQAPSYIRVFDPTNREVRDIYHAPTLRAHDINLSWDAKTVFIGGGGIVAEVGADGEGYRTITSGQSPAELPDGRLVFFDDAPGISACKADHARQLLFTVNRDGTQRKLVSANLTIDTTPQVMDDGRVVFCRWDYGVNKNVFHRHAIWTQNPDGTMLDLLFGNTIIDPWAFYLPRQVPGRPEVVVTFGTHHVHNAGLVGLIWEGRGREGADGAGFRRITHDTASVGDRAPVWAYHGPYPLHSHLFLVSYDGGLYLLDRYGNKKCIFEPARDLAVYSPQPLVPRRPPPIHPDRTTNAEWQPVDLQQQLLTDPDWSRNGTLLLQDVYQGISPEVERGRVKFLAVKEQVVHNEPRGGAMGLGSAFYAHRLVGLVPVEEDGSAHFEVPALRSLYFHALDRDGRMLMTMGSDMHVMPGEVRSCVGCHEHRKNIHAPVARPTIAAGKPPVRPELPSWGTRGILEYEAVVQPVFDKHCVACHGGPAPEGGLDLTGSRTTVFNMSYMELVDKGLVHFVPGAGHTHAQPSLDYDEQAPLSRGSLLSKLTQYLDDPEHSGARVPWDERYRVYAWIDANVPFYSHYTQQSPTILKQDARKALADVYQRRCAACHDQRPRRDAVPWLSRWHIWTHVPPQPGQWNIADSGMRVRHLNLTAPAHSAALQAPLAKEAGGLGRCAGPDGAPVFRDKADNDYQQVLEALSHGVIHRTGPDFRGVQEILRQLE